MTVMSHRIFASCIKFIRTWHSAERKHLTGLAEFIPTLGNGSLECARFRFGNCFNQLLDCPSVVCQFAGLRGRLLCGRVFPTSVPVKRQLTTKVFGDLFATRTALVALTKNIVRQIKPADNRFQHSLANVLPLMKSDGVTFRTAIDIWVVNHPLRTLTAPAIENKLRVVVMENTKNVLRFLRSRHRQESIQTLYGHVNVSAWLQYLPRQRRGLRRAFLFDRFFCPPRCLSVKSPEPFPIHQRILLAL